MFSILLTPFLMLLSVFGLYSPPSRHSPQFEHAVIHASLAATTTERKTHTLASTGQAPPHHASSSADEVRDPSRINRRSDFARSRLGPSPSALAEVHSTSSPRTSVSGLATGAEPVLTSAPEPQSNPITRVQSDFATDTETRILVLMNAERAHEGLPPLSPDARLAAVARAHSADMLARDYFDHSDPDGCSSSCRADAADYSWSTIGENIYMTEGYEISSEKESGMVVDGWMHSPGHRANILGAKFTNAGVGVAIQGETVYITALYAKPR